MERHVIQNSKRIVIKVGSSILATKDYALDNKWIKDFARQVTVLLTKGYEVIIVSSGAIAAGMGILGMKKRPKSLPEQQACAALGQGYLMKIYEDSFKRSSFHTAQVLLTWEDIGQRKRYLNVENTLRALLSKRAVPIINENDTVSIDEIKFGDNDKLSALVANIVDADLLIMLTDVDGLYDGNKKCIGIIKEIDDGIENIAGGTNKEGSKGGMRTKLDACKISISSGINCVIANGRKKDILLRILKGEDIGTLFVANKNKMGSRKKWIAYHTKAQGKVIVDDGAKEAILKKNKSLLPCGVKKVEGKFLYGDVVLITDINGKAFAKGLSSYNRDDLDNIKGLSTKDAEKVIKEGFYEEAVHRDNLAII